MASLSLDRARKQLLYLWFTFAAADMALLFGLWLLDYIGIVAFLAGLEQLSQCFGPYLGAMLVFFYPAGPRLGGSPTRDWPHRLAMACSLLWNLMILAVLCITYFRGDIGDHLSVIKHISSYFSWLVAASIAFYFSDQVGD